MTWYLLGLKISDQGQAPSCTEKTKGVSEQLDCRIGTKNAMLMARLHARLIGYSDFVIY